jgi:hypothetical protein
MKRTVCRELASTVLARLNCIQANNKEWQPKHEERIQRLVDNFLPSGSGLDNGVHIDLDKSTGNKLVFHTSFHHMNQDGYYDGWTDHTLFVVPCLWTDFDIKISGPNRNEIKEDLYQRFEIALHEEIEAYAEC